MESPNRGETTPNAILSHVKTQTRRGWHFPLGLATTSTPPCSDDLAAANRAAADYVKPGENIRKPRDSVFDKVSSPR
jgi:hypothetical protein